MASTCWKPKQKAVLISSGRTSRARVIFCLRSLSSYLTRLAPSSLLSLCNWNEWLELLTLLAQLADMSSIHAVLTVNADSNGFYEQEEVRQRENRLKFLQQHFTKLKRSALELKQKATLWLECLAKCFFCTCSRW